MERFFRFSPKCKRGILANPLLALRAQIVMLVLAASASAQPKITLAPPKDGKSDAIIPVMAQGARVAAVSDVHGLLAFGHDRSYPDANVSLVKLDAKGNPAAFATQFKLPNPPALAPKFPNYVNGLAFHPKLPLLYVWQDVPAHYTNPPPPPPPGTMEFDHLCIFNLAKDPPELVVSMCRGVEYIYGQQGGALAVDPTGSYLYVPNLRELKNAGSLRFGRFPLDADGLPALTDAKDPIAARVKKLTEINAAGKGIPPQMTPIEYVHLFNLTPYGSGHSFVPIGKDVVISSGFQGLIAWRPEEKHTTLHGLPFKHAGHTQFVVHPTLPAVFATARHQPLNSFFRAEQHEGYLTSLPRQYVIEGSDLMGPPAILSKQKQLAVGGEYYVYLIGLDDKAFPTDDVTRVYVNCPHVRALVYSERFERAYVGVEVSK
jgi:hypothetical protein